jgi:hypothetical protein
MEAQMMTEAKHKDVDILRQNKLIVIRAIASGYNTPEDCIQERPEIFAWLLDDESDTLSYDRPVHAYSSYNDKSNAMHFVDEPIEPLYEHDGPGIMFPDLDDWELYEAELSESE